MFLFLLNRCCAAAWDKKMRDTVGQTTEGYIHKGCAASASVRHFLFCLFYKILCYI
jgi:hypothetical protein